MRAVQLQLACVCLCVWAVTLLAGEVAGKEDTVQPGRGGLGDVNYPSGSTGGEGKDITQTSTSPFEVTSTGELHDNDEEVKDGTSTKRTQQSVNADVSKFLKHFIIDASPDMDITYEKVEIPASGKGQKKKKSEVRISKSRAPKTPLRRRSVRPQRRAALAAATTTAGPGPPLAEEAAKAAALAAAVARERDFESARRAHPPAAVQSVYADDSASRDSFFPETSSDPAAPPLAAQFDVVMERLQLRARLERASTCKTTTTCAPTTSTCRSSPFTFFFLPVTRSTCTTTCSTTPSTSTCTSTTTTCTTTTCTTTTPLPVPKSTCTSNRIPLDFRLFTTPPTSKCTRTTRCATTDIRPFTCRRSSSYSLSGNQRVAFQQEHMTELQTFSPKRGSRLSGTNHRIHKSTHQPEVHVYRCVEDPDGGVICSCDDADASPATVRLPSDRPRRHHRRHRSTPGPPPSRRVKQKRRRRRQRGGRSAARASASAAFEPPPVAAAVQSVANHFVKLLGMEDWQQQPDHTLKTSLVSFPPDGTKVKPNEQQKKIAKFNPDPETISEAILQGKEDYVENLATEWDKELEDAMKETQSSSQSEATGGTTRGHKETSVNTKKANLKQATSAWEVGVESGPPRCTWPLRASPSGRPGLRARRPRDRRDDRVEVVPIWVAPLTSILTPSPTTRLGLPPDSHRFPAWSPDDRRGEQSPVPRSASTFLPAYVEAGTTTAAPADSTEPPEENPRETRPALPITSIPDLRASTNDPHFVDVPSDRKPPLKGLENSEMATNTRDEGNRLNEDFLKYVISSAREMTPRQGRGLESGDDKGPSANALPLLLSYHPGSTHGEELHSQHPSLEVMTNELASPGREDALPRLPEHGISRHLSKTSIPPLETHQKAENNDLSYGADGNNFLFAVSRDSTALLNLRKASSASKMHRKPKQRPTKTGTLNTKKAHGSRLQTTDVVPEMSPTLFITPLPLEDVDSSLSLPPAIPSAPVITEDSKLAPHSTPLDNTIPMNFNPIPADMLARSVKVLASVHSILPPKPISPNIISPLPATSVGHDSKSFLSPLYLYNPAQYPAAEKLYTKVFPSYENKYFTNNVPAAMEQKPYAKNPPPDSREHFGSNAKRPSNRPAERRKLILANNSTRGRTPVKANAAEKYFGRGDEIHPSANIPVILLPNQTMKEEAKNLVKTMPASKKKAAQNTHRLQDVHPVTGYRQNFPCSSKKHIVYETTKLLLYPNDIRKMDTLAGGVESERPQPYTYNPSEQPQRPVASFTNALKPKSAHVAYVTSDTKRKRSSSLRVTSWGTTGRLLAKAAITPGSDFATLLKPRSQRSSHKMRTKYIGLVGTSPEDQSLRLPNSEETSSYPIQSFESGISTSSNAVGDVKGRVTTDSPTTDSSTTDSSTTDSPTILLDAEPVATWDSSTQGSSTQHLPARKHSEFSLKKWALGVVYRSSVSNAAPLVASVSKTLPAELSSASKLLSSGGTESHSTMTSTAPRNPKGSSPRRPASSDVVATAISTAKFDADSLDDGKFASINPVKDNSKPHARLTNSASTHSYAPPSSSFHKLTQEFLESSSELPVTTEDSTSTLEEQTSDFSTRLSNKLASISSVARSKLKTNSSVHVLESAALSGKLLHTGTIDAAEAIRTIIEGNSGCIKKMNPTRLAKLLDHLDQVALEQMRVNAVAQWNYETNMTQDSRRDEVEAAVEQARFQRALVRSVREVEAAAQEQNVKLLPLLARRLGVMTFAGTAALVDEKVRELEALVADMEDAYDSVVCNYRKRQSCNMPLDPEVMLVMSTSRDAAELSYYWRAWHDATGRRMRHQYPIFVKLMNEAARLNGLRDATALWLAPYEEPGIRAHLKELWQRLRPLYEELHAHVRHRLRCFFGAAAVPERSPLPAHLLGPPPAQAWGRVAAVAAPYPKEPLPDVSAAMRKMNWTAERLFREADKFMASLNLTSAPCTLWERSMFVRPAGRRVLCHASAWDFFDGHDLRVKACSAPTLDDFAVACHEMGHIQYFMQYRDQPVAFREAANPGFHEAVGDVMALAATGAPHLRRLGLLPEQDPKKAAEKAAEKNKAAAAAAAQAAARQTHLNLLMESALERLPLLPVSLALEHWRWDTFERRVRPNSYTRRWWHLMEKYAGVGPPVARSDEDFDPGAKYHVAAGAPYVQYFVSGILQYQLFRSLCVTAGQYDPRHPSEKPLFLCDLYGNATVGIRLRDMMRLGSSVPWPAALSVATGGEEHSLNAQGLLDYYAPLRDWLRAENQRTGEPLGWHSCR